MAYDENIRIIAEELERLKNRPTGDKLPEVETTDEGKVLTVNSSGEWDAEDIPNQLPAVESTDEGKVLSVNSSGEWAAADPSSSYDLDFSTTEKNTGMKWIDGKPIYERVFINLSQATSGTSWVSLSQIDASDWEQLLDLKIYGENNSGIYIGMALAEFSLDDSATTHPSMSLCGSFDRTITKAVCRYTKTGSTKKKGAK